MYSMLQDLESPSTPPSPCPTRQDIDSPNPPAKLFARTMDPMQPFMRPPSREELRAVLKANAAFLAIYFTAIRATPLVRHCAPLPTPYAAPTFLTNPFPLLPSSQALDFAYAAYNHYSN